MTAKNLERANEIQKRMEKLEKVREWIEDGRCIYVLGRGCTLNETVELSQDARTLIYGLCIGECVRLQKEFESL